MAATPQPQPKKKTKTTKILMILIKMKYISITAYRNTEIKSKILLHYLH